MTAREVDDGPDADARGLEVDEELREPLVLLVRHHLGPEERDGIVRDVGVARPDLGAVDAIASLDLLGPRADRGEIPARVGPAHAEGEGELAPCGPGKKALPVLLRARAVASGAGSA